MTTTMGVVSRHPLTADGEVDGFVLEQGGVAQVPLHFAQQVVTLAPVGADVKVIGQSLPGPDGEKGLQSEMITNVNNDASLKLGATTLAEPQLPADRTRITPSEIPDETADAMPQSPTEPLDGAIIMPGDNPPVPSMRTPIRSGGRVMEPSMAPPPPDRLTVPPPGAPVLPSARPIAPGVDAPAQENVPPDVIE